MKLKYIGIKNVLECPNCHQVGWRDEGRTLKDTPLGYGYGKFNRVVSTQSNMCYDYDIASMDNTDGWCQINYHYIPRSKL